MTSLGSSIYKDDSLETGIRTHFCELIKITLLLLFKEQTTKRHSLMRPVDGFLRTFSESGAE